MWRPPLLLSKPLKLCLVENVNIDLINAGDCDYSQCKHLAVHSPLIMGHPNRLSMRDTCEYVHTYPMLAEYCWFKKKTYVHSTMNPDALCRVCHVVVAGYCIGHILVTYIQNDPNWIRFPTVHPNVTCCAPNVCIWAHLT